MSPNTCNHPVYISGQVARTTPYLGDSPITEIQAGWFYSKSYMKRELNYNLPGIEVWNTNSSIFLVTNMLCGKLPCHKGLCGKLPCHKGIEASCLTQNPAPRGHLSDFLSRSRGSSRTGVQRRASLDLAQIGPASGRLVDRIRGG